MGRNSKESNVIRGNFGGTPFLERDEPPSDLNDGADASGLEGSAVNQAHPLRRRVAAAGVGLVFSAALGGLGVPWALNKWADHTSKKCVPTGEVIPASPEPPYQVVERRIFEDSLHSKEGKSEIDEGCTLRKNPPKPRELGPQPIVLYAWR